ncbi:MAG: hypothetical protein KTR31_15320 [Myxococcales bacterium]|nr:hypothetical protein [Myxococcales bacterium]
MSDPRVEVRLRSGVPHPTVAFDAARHLGRQVASHHGLEHCTVVVNDNRRNVMRWRTPPTEVSVHWALLEAPDDVVAVLGGDAEAWDRLQERLPRPSAATLRAAGEVHDLGALLQQERALYARLAQQPAPSLAVTWGRWPTVAPRRGLQLGSCEVNTGLVRIHPVLDHVDVPAWFVGFVLYHELLHVVHQPVRSRKGSRRAVHTAAFRAAESRHPQAARAQQWEQRHVRHLLERCRQRLRGSSR